MSSAIASTEWIRMGSFIGSPRTAGTHADSSRLRLRLELRPRDVLRLALLAGQPRVPEIEPWRRAELAAQLLAGDVERVVVTKLHLADVLVMNRLDAFQEGLALLRVALLSHLGDQALLLLVAPPTLERAAEGDVERRVGIEGIAGHVGLPQLRLLDALVERRPVDDLKIDDEAEGLELLLGHQRRLVHELVFARADPAHGLAGVAGLLHQALGLFAIALVVERRARGDIPRRLLGKEQRRAQTIEVLVTESRDHDRFHVEGRLYGLAQSPARHEAGLVVHRDERPPARLDDPRFELRQRLDPVPVVLLHEHRVVILAGLHAGLAHGGVRHRDEEDLVEPRRAL